MNEARSAGASVLCLPELCITGYGCEDAFHAVGTQNYALQVLGELLPETRGMVDRAFLSSFVKPLIVINTSRGPVVRTSGLLDALQTGHVIAAGLDVFERETSSFETVANEGDPVWMRLMAHPRVQVSPHVAGWTEESYVKLSSVLADKVLSDFG